MSIINMYLNEAVEKTNIDVINKIISEFKKCLNTCRLSKFKSDSECQSFYLAFFTNTLNDTSLGIEDWGIIYNSLLNDNNFCAALALYLAAYHPNEYTSMFTALQNRINNDLENITKNRIRYLSKTKAILMMIQCGLNAVFEVVKNQISDQKTLQFITSVSMSLESVIMNVNKLLLIEIKSANTDNDIVVNYHGIELSESAEEFINVLNTSDNFINQFNELSDTLMNESIVNKASEIAKQAAVKLKKMQEQFDERVIKSWKKLQNERRNRKHDEIVGESLRITNEIKRFIVSAPAALISPALAVIIWTGTLIMDRQTDKKDRDVLIGQIKDELEIIEEKIQISDRKGDDKERIELIRIRQKLIKEYERISKIRYRKQL